MRVKKFVAKYRPPKVFFAATNGVYVLCLLLSQPGTDLVLGCRGRLDQRLKISVVILLTYACAFSKFVCSCVYCVNVRQRERWKESFEEKLEYGLSCR